MWAKLQLRPHRKVAINIGICQNLWCFLLKIKRPVLRLTCLLCVNYFPPSGFLHFLRFVRIPPTRIQTKLRIN